MPSWLLSLVVLAVGLGIAALEWAFPRHTRWLAKPLGWALGGYAVAHLLWVVFLCVVHAQFPLHIDLMEGSVWQHFQRAAAFEAIYPAPTPEYVPLAYNPLYYFVAIPFGWVLGKGLFALRLVAVVGMLGSGLVLYAVARAKTGSRWWGLMAIGLFAAAYRAMDTHLDTAHSDSWFLCAALLGTLILDRHRSRGGQLAGIALLVASFWFKQHGALFVLGGLLAITWRDGVKRTIPAWLLAAGLGPALYVLAGPVLFGSHFHYFTWEVPSGWSEYTPGLLRRFVGFVVKRYAVLAAAAVGIVGWAALGAWRDRWRPNVWEVQLVFALLTGLMGSLDAGSADNVYIAMGTWLILMGTLGLHSLASSPAAAARPWPHLVALLVSFALLAYDPRTVVTSPGARQSYADFIELLRSLPGTVYAPAQGQLVDGYTFYPAAHWVALDDMTRGPRRGPEAQVLAAQLLAPVRHPKGPAYILTNQPLELTAPVLADLTQVYVLESDLGNRFERLRVLPKLYDHGWPRYLYRYEPGRALSHWSSGRPQQSPLAENPEPIRD